MKILKTMMALFLLITILAGCSTKTVTNDFAATVDRLNIKVRELERENEQLKKQLGTQNTPAPAITPTSTVANVPKPTAASTQKSASTSSGYQRIYDEYAKKIREKAPSVGITELAEIANEGVGKMAEYMYSAKGTDGQYATYESWAGKLMDVYMNNAR